MQANTVSRLLVAGTMLLGFAAASTSISANDRMIVAPWMTMGETPDFYYGPYWGPRPFSQTWPSSIDPALRPSSRRMSGPRVPFPGSPNPPEPLAGGCPPGFAVDRRPFGPPGFVPPPFAPCPPSP